MSLQNKSYRFRIYPNKEQEGVLVKMFGCSRFVWNYFLNKEKEHYKETKKYLSYFDNAKSLTSLKKQEETKFLKEVNSQSLQQSLKNLDIAYQRFFKKKSGFPKFKNKNDKQSFCIPQRFSIKNGKLYIPKIREGIKIKQHRKIYGKIKTSTLSKSKTGKYYISICVEENINKLPRNNNSIGIDLGIKSFAFLSDGQEIPNNNFLKTQTKKLKRARQHLSRKQKGSNRRNKQKLKVARIYEKITNQKQDFLHKTSIKLIRKNQTICLEDLNVKGMLQNHKLAKSIQDCSWSTFVEMLKYKAKWYGRNVIFVDRFFPSSKTCSDCGWINQNLQLKDREWNCQSCGVVHQRDLNASKNILKQGLISSGIDDYRHGENVRPNESLANLGEVSKIIRIDSNKLTD